MGIRENILDVFEVANSVERSEGRMAYFSYNRTLKEIGDNLDLPVTSVAGVFAALSPNSAYKGNLRSCLTLCMGFVRGVPIEQCPVTTYNHNRAKAWKLLQGDHFYEVYQGLKVRNFWRCLVEPNHPEAITIDGHMANIAHGEPRSLINASLSKREYRELAKDFSNMAVKVGLLPSQFQAILWFTWKRMHRLAYDGAGSQPTLWEDDNEWVNYVPFKAIKPLTLFGE